MWHSASVFMLKIAAKLIRKGVLNGFAAQYKLDI
jgi:hypothetical protein